MTAKRGWLICILCLLLTGLPLTAQEPDWETLSKELLAKTLPLEIQRAGYFELQAWCRQLGLDTSGTRSALQQRLHRHFGTEPLPGADPAGVAPGADGDGGSGDEIIIRSAEDMDYFTLEEVDETYVEILGDVVLEMRRKQGREIHQITADRVLFNQAQNLLTAEGSVEYLLRSEEKTDRFFGESLSINIESWEGLFLQGATEQSRTVDDEEILFTFRGEQILRGRNEVVILKDGEITSSRAANPSYRLRAERIWVLTSGEWALQNATLQVGRVPLLWIPAILKPGDDLFFHPSFGFRDREGFFFQTTTYLLGRAEKDEEADLSFLQAEDESGPLKREGLFLREVDSLPPFSQKLHDYAGETGSYLKLMADFYTNLGLFAGIEGSLSELGILKTLEIYAGAGFSRQIVQTAQGYTPLQDDGSGSLVSVWDKSYLFGLILPFRFGVNLNLRLKTGEMSFDLKLPYYTDTLFRSDFDNRTEDIQWMKIMGMSEEQETSTGSLSNPQWRGTLTYRTPLAESLDLVKTLSLDKLEVLLSWRNRDIPDSWDKSTEEYFFYPDTLTLPSFGLTMKGFLLGKEPEAAAKDEELAELPRDLLPPAFADQGDGEGTGKAATGRGVSGARSPEAPARRDDLPLPEVTESLRLYQGDLSYTIKPRFSAVHKFFNSQWTTPEDIDSRIAYRFLKSDLQGEIDYNGEFWEEYLRIDWVNSFDGTYSLHTDMDLISASQRQSYLDEDNQASEARLDTDFKVTALPLAATGNLGKSRLQYNFKGTIWDYSYADDGNRFLTTWLGWNSTTVNRHRMDLLFKNEDEGDYQSLSWSLQLPPLEWESRFVMDLAWGPFSGKLDWSWEEPESGGALILQPLTAKAGYRFANGKIEQEMEYDFELGGVNGSQTSLLFFGDDKSWRLATSLSYDFLQAKAEQWSLEAEWLGVSLSYVMRDTVPYLFSAGSGWSSAGGSAFLPYALKAGYSLEWEPDPFWKNRIRFQVDADALWAMDLVRFTNNSFTFDLDLTLEIFEFLDFQFSSESENISTFRYFPSYSQDVGFSVLNPLIDLVKSFNFLNPEDRISSNFNLKKISFALIHDLTDWNLHLEYSGKPVLDTEGGDKRYVWSTEFSVYLQWDAVPEFKTEIDVDDEGFRF